MALAAIMPVTWSPILIYFGITIILGLLDWTGLARAVRSKLLSLREEDYVLAAQLMGAKPSRIIGRHLIPGFMSHLIATATISIPGMILGETALSFLGLGLRPPITSWGILLTEARSVSVIAFYPWLLLPDGAGGAGDPRLQLPRRRPEGRGRSVQVGARLALPLEGRVARRRRVGVVKGRARHLPPHPAGFAVDPPLEGGGARRNLAGLLRGSGMIRTNQVRTRSGRQGHRSAAGRGARRRDRADPAARHRGCGLRSPARATKTPSPRTG